MSEGTISDGNADVAVLLLGFGGPEKIEDVRPFIENVVRDRHVPKTRIEAVVQQYKDIGGRSPFNELTAKQAAALQRMLRIAFPAIKVYTGMLFWNPYIADTVKQMQEAGVKRAVGVIMAPHRTEASHEKYVQAVESALSATGYDLSVEYLPSWSEDSLYVEAIVERIADSMRELSDQQVSSCELIFTAHSVPQAMSDKSGYAAQVKATAQSAIMQLRAQFGMDFAWSVGYQSRSGSALEPWLEPDVITCIKDAKKAGKAAVVVVPIGFVCDHVEVLVDLDSLAGAAAKEAGIFMVRAATVGDHPKFIRTLADLTRTTIESFYVKPER